MALRKREVTFLICFRKRGVPSEKWGFQTWRKLCLNYYAFKYGYNFITYIYHFLDPIYLIKIVVVLPTNILYTGLLKVYAKKRNPLKVSIVYKQERYQLLCIQHNFQGFLTLPFLNHLSIFLSIPLF